MLSPILLKFPRFWLNDAIPPNGRSILSGLHMLCVDIGEEQGAGISPWGDQEDDQHNRNAEIYACGLPGNPYRTRI
jgi:hypothetical protein